MFIWLKKLIGRPSIGKREAPPEAFPQRSTEPVGGIGTAKTKIKLVPSQAAFDLQVGIDFGTSSTKVCYQNLRVDGKIHPITDWNPPAPYPKYSIPSVAAFNEKQELLLGNEAAAYLTDKPWDDGFTRFKVVMAGKLSEEFRNDLLEAQYEEYAGRVAGDPTLGNAEWITAAYLAYVMRKTRSHLIRTLQTKNLDIRFNVCMPLQHRMTETVWEHFNSVLAVAQHTYRSCDANATSHELFEFVRNCFGSITYGRDGDNRVFAISESLAQIYAYKKALGRYKGIHALIDIGGGSTDICIGTINQNNEPRWFATKNIPRGMKFIEKQLIDKVIGANGSLPDVTKVLASKPLLPESIAIIRAGLEMLWERSVEVWASAFHMYDRTSYWDRNNVHVFLCGGGSEIEMSEHIFARSWLDRNRFNGLSGPYPVHHFEKPTNYVDPQEQAPFARMAVAYGLSYPEPELGEYGTSEDIAPAVFPPQTERDTPYIGICGEQ